MVEPEVLGRGEPGETNPTKFLIHFVSTIKNCPSKYNSACFLAQSSPNPHLIWIFGGDVGFCTHAYIDSDAPPESLTSYLVVCRRGPYTR